MRKSGLWIGVMVIFLMAASQAALATIGDVDGDGAIDGYDAVLILRSDVGLVELTTQQQTAADTSGDSTVDGYDAVLILRYDVDMITEFPNAGRVITVTTTVMAPTGGVSRVAGRVVHARAAVTAAVVKIITANGTQYTMTDNGSGVYTATVSGLSGNFVIEARKGDLVLENMFNNITAGASEFNAGETNDKTTAFVEIAKVMVESLNVSGVDTSNNLNLLESLNNAQVSIDMMELRTDVVDLESPSYTEVVSSYRAVLVAADQNGAGENDCLEVFTQSEEYQQTVTAIETITPPAESDDKTAIRNVIEAVFAAYTGRNSAALLSNMSNDYIDAGYDKTGQLVRWQADWTECTEEYVTPLLIDIESMTESQATVHIKDIWQATCGGVPDYEQSYWKTYMAKEGGVWKWKGNQEKIDLWWGAEDVTSAGSNNHRYYLYTGFEETSLFPVQSATVTSTKLTSGTATITKNEDDSRWYNSTQNNSLTGPPAKGDTFTLNVGMADSTAETYTLQLQAAAPDINASITTSPALIPGPDGGEQQYLCIASGTQSVPLSYLLTGDADDIGSWDIWIGHTSQSGPSFEYQAGGPLTTTSVVLPTAGMPSATYPANQTTDNQYIQPQYPGNTMHSRLQFRSIFETTSRTFEWTTIYNYNPETDYYCGSWRNNQ